MAYFTPILGLLALASTTIATHGITTSISSTKASQNSSSSQNSSASPPLDAHTPLLVDPTTTNKQCAAPHNSMAVSIIPTEPEHLEDVLSQRYDLQRTSSQAQYSTTQANRLSEERIRQRQRQLRVWMKQSQNGMGEGCWLVLRERSIWED